MSAITLLGTTFMVVGVLFGLSVMVDDSDAVDDSDEEKVGNGLVDFGRGVSM